MTVEKPKPKQLLQPIATGAGSAMNQSQFLAILCNSLQAREKSRVHGAIGFGFASHRLKNWRESFKPITKRRNRDHVITFDSHLKTALYCSMNEDFLPWSSHQQYLSMNLVAAVMVRIPSLLLGLDLFIYNCISVFYSLTVEWTTRGCIVWQNSQSPD